MTAEKIQTWRTLPGRRGTASQTVELEAAIVRKVDARHTITVRGVCYSLFTEVLILKISVLETVRITCVLTDKREVGSLDWPRVVDGTRPVDSVTQWSDPSAIIDAAVRGYRSDNWQEQPVAIKVWSVKSTVAGVIAPILQELDVKFPVMRGFRSFTAVTQAAEDSHASDPDKECFVLYGGDWLKGGANAA
jgi:hypothetical protein